MRYSRIDHVAVVVRDLERAIRCYRDSLGFEVEGVAEFPHLGIRQAFIPLGEAYLHLVEPTDPEGPVAKFMERRGEGLYLLAVITDEMEETLSSLRSRGVRVIGGEPEDLQRGGLVMIHPGSASGVLIQLIERENRFRKEALKDIP
jgi:methylmalonyl-CoA/ethylmalonyl-CoA epimerase